MVHSFGFSNKSHFFDNNSKCIPVNWEDLKLWIYTEYPYLATQYRGAFRTLSRSSHRRCSIRKGDVLRNFAKVTGKHLCQSIFFNKKETQAQVFPCEFFESSTNTFFTEFLWAIASPCQTSMKKYSLTIFIKKFYLRCLARS